MKRLNVCILPAVLIFVLISIFMFGSCKVNKAEEQIIGKWELSDEFSTKGIRIPSNIEFFSDGSVQSDWGGKYSIEGEKLNIYYSAMDSYSYTFKINNNTLTLKSDIGEYSNDETEYTYLRSESEENSTDKTEIEDDATPKLSDECDYILATGTSSAGDIFELVANESHTYDSRQSVGLIKNNEWLINMTSESPIIDEKTGSIYYFSSFKDEYEMYGQNIQQLYELVTDNCFLLNNYILWNFETGKTYKTYTSNNNERFILNVNVTDESKVIINEKNSNSFKLLDTNSMAIVKEFDNNQISDRVEPFAEGMFFANGYTNDLDGDGYNDEVSGFYDENGNLVIDLSQYNVTYGGVFSEGTATIKAENNTGKSFEITIDKNGNVISEKETN